MQSEAHQHQEQATRAARTVQSSSNKHREILLAIGKAKQVAAAQKHTSSDSSSSSCTEDEEEATWKRHEGAHVNNTFERYPQIPKTPKVEKAMGNLKCWMALRVNGGFDNGSCAKTSLPQNRWQLWSVSWRYLLHWDVSNSLKDNSKGKKNVLSMKYI